VHTSKEKNRRVNLSKELAKIESVQGSVGVCASKMNFHFVYKLPRNLLGKRKKKNNGGEKWGKEKKKGKMGWESGKKEGKKEEGEGGGRK
jgi:hypothetical protein